MEKNENRKDNFEKISNLDCFVNGQLVHSIGFFSHLISSPTSFSYSMVMLLPSQFLAATTDKRAWRGMPAERSQIRPFGEVQKMNVVWFGKPYQFLVGYLFSFGIENKNMWNVSIKEVPWATFATPFSDSRYFLFIYM